MYEDMPVVEQLGEIGGEIKDAVFSQDESAVVSFPGLSLMGFSIPAASVDVWEFFPTVHDMVRDITTFLFVAAFLRYLHDLADGIFGTSLPNGEDDRGDSE